MGWLGDNLGLVGGVGLGMGLGGYVGGNLLSGKKPFGGSKDNPATAANPYASLMGENPNYTPGYDPKTMSLRPQMEKDLAGVNYNQEGLNAYRNEALRTGQSRFEGLAKQDQSKLASQGLSQARSQAAGGAADAMSNLAASGGLNSGARERAQLGAQRGLMAAGQGITQGQQNANRQIAMTGEQNRLQQLQNLPGMETSAFNAGMDKAKTLGQASQFDTSNQVQENLAKNQFELGKFASRQSAMAQAMNANRPQQGLLSSIFSGIF